uniref:Uncharacterized protein n=1 Tax=Lepeophtheirus salmonis TaxID=72036 RepID=A0A0K2VCU8_LEPSM
MPLDNHYTIVLIKFPFSIYNYFIKKKRKKKKSAVLGYKKEKKKECKFHVYSVPWRIQAPTYVYSFTKFEQMTV